MAFWNSGNTKSDEGGTPTGELYSLLGFLYGLVRQNPGKPLRNSPDRSRRPNCGTGFAFSLRS